MSTLAQKRSLLGVVVALAVRAAVSAQTLDRATLLVQVRSDTPLRTDTVLLIRGPRGVLTKRVPTPTKGAISKLIPFLSNTFSVPNLEPGRYALSATSGDLCTAAVVSVYLAAGQTARAVVPLAPCKTGAGCEQPTSIDPLVSTTSGSYHATGSSGGFLQLCGPQGSLMLRGHSPSSVLTALAFSPDLRFLASGSDDETVIMSDTATGLPIRRFDLGNATRLVQFSSDGRYLASADDRGTVKVWDVIQGRIAATGSTSGKIDSLEFAPDASFVVASSGKQQQFVQVRPSSKP